MIQIDTERKIIVGDPHEIKAEVVDILYMIYDRVKEVNGEEAAKGILFNIMMDVVKKKQKNMVWESSLAEMLGYTD